MDHLLTKPYASRAAALRASRGCVSPATLASVGLTEDDRALQWGKGWVSLQSAIGRAHV